MIERIRRLNVVWCGLTLVILSACATPGKKAEVRTERDAVVTVEAIDVPNRLVTVREASGEKSVYYVSETIRTFPQAKVGDRVRMRYVESIALEMKKPGTSSPDLQFKEETVRPQPGDPTHGSARTETKATVKIEKVDKKGQTVTFTGPRGRRVAIVNDPTLREFTKKLRPGDEVEATFAEAVALSLEPVAR